MKLTKGLTKRINNDTLLKEAFQKRIRADFFKTAQGNEPARDFLKTLPRDVHCLRRQNDFAARFYKENAKNSKRRF